MGEGRSRSNAGGKWRKGVCGTQFAGKDAADVVDDRQRTRLGGKRKRWQGRAARSVETQRGGNLRGRQRDRH